MIVLKNIFKQDDFTGKLEFDGQYKFRIKDSIFIVYKKMTFFEKIFSYNMQEDKKTENCSSLSKPESNDNNCLNISDSNYQSENSQKETLLQNQKYDENQSDDFLTSFEEESSYSDEYSFDDNFQERKNIENTFLITADTRKIFTEYRYFFGNRYLVVSINNADTNYYCIIMYKEFNFGFC